MTISGDSTSSTCAVSATSVDKEYSSHKLLILALGSYLYSVRGDRLMHHRRWWDSRVHESSSIEGLDEKNRSYRRRAAVLDSRATTAAVPLFRLYLWY
jgi:hypothetical protein